MFLPSAWGFPGLSRNLALATSGLGERPPLNHCSKVGTFSPLPGRGGNVLPGQRCWICPSTAIKDSGGGGACHACVAMSK